MGRAQIGQKLSFESIEVKTVMYRSQMRMCGIEAIPQWRRVFLQHGFKEAGINQGTRSNTLYVNGNAPLQAELGKSIAALPRDRLHFRPAFVRFLRCRRRKMDYHIFSPELISLLHGQSYHFHGQFPFITVYIAEERPRRRLGIPLKLNQWRVDTPLQVITPEQPFEPGEFTSREIIELAAAKAIANYHLVEKVKVMAVKAEIAHNYFLGPIDLR
jgi:hypothetical protein